MKTLGVFIKVQPWISWGLNILGIVAVFAYGLRGNIFPKAFWLMVLISYISIRIYELFPYGLVPADTSLDLMLLVGLKYVYLVIPSLLCLCYFCLNRNAYDKNL